MKNLFISIFLLCYTGLSAQVIHWIGGDGMWDVPSNWSCNCVPNGFDVVDMDNVTVTIPSGYTVSIRSIIVKVNGILINEDSIILANSGAEVLRIEGVLENHGVIQILQAISSAIDLSGMMINTGTITIDSVLTTGIKWSGTNATLQNDGLIAIISSPDKFGLFCPPTSGQLLNGPNGHIIIKHSQSNASNIEFNGLIHNEGLIELFDGDFGGTGKLINEGDLIMDNAINLPQQGIQMAKVMNLAEGLISMQYLSTWAFIYCDSIINHGTIEIAHTATDGMHLGGTVLHNYGMMHLADIGRYGLLTGIDTELRNEQGATIHIAGTRASGIRLERIEMYNGGLIQLDTVGSSMTADADHGIDCVTLGRIYNDTLSEIRIDSCYASGINLTTAFMSTNHGVIHIRHSRQNGILMSGNHILQNSGSIDIDTIQAVGIVLSGTNTNLYNSGLIRIGAKMDLTDFSINNASTFKNDSCGYIYTINKMRNTGTLINYGFLHNRSTNAHTFTAGGNTRNEGVIEDYNGFITANNNVDNFGIILNGRTSSGCPGEVINNVLSLGNNQHYSVTGIFADNAVQNNIAMYDSLTNTALQSDIFPETLDWLWVFRHINTGCEDTMRMKITVNCPIICATGDTIYWTGCDATAEWFDAGNWTAGIPSANSLVIIPYLATRPYPKVTASTSIHSLALRRETACEIMSGATLTLE